MSAPSISAASRAPGMGVPMAGSRPRAGRLLVAVASALLVVVVLVQLLDRSGVLGLGLATWRPTLYAYIVWGVALCVGQVMIRGERGQQALFVLPAVLFTAAMAIFPMLFGLCIAFTDWNLSAFAGRRFNGFDNIRAMFHDPFYWNAIVQHGAYYGCRARRVRHRVRSGAAAECRHPGTEVLPGRLPPAVHADARSPSAG